MKDRIIGKVQMKDTAYDFAGAFLQALGVWCFIEPCMIAPGGVSGMAILINHLTKLPVGIMTLVLNIPLLASSYVCLNRRMTWKTIRTVLVMTLVLDGLVTPLIPQYVGDKLISSVFTDVPVGKWVTDPVAWAVQNGITSGTSDTTFSPDKVCSRGEIVTFLHRAYVPEASLVSDF